MVQIRAAGIRIYRRDPSETEKTSKEHKENIETMISRERGKILLVMKRVEKEQEGGG